MKIYFKKYLFFLFLLWVSVSNAQLVSGKILFERRTNLYKKFKNERIRNWIKEDEKNKTDFFELWFTDSVSLFIPKDDGLRDRLSWATAKNTVYQNFNSGLMFTIKSIWSEELYMEDSLRTRTWKITDSKRKICGYDCRKAIWEFNDTVRIYAWYTDWIVPSTGPESFNGLPGMILGIATEDGGVVYFAKSVEMTAPTKEILTPPKTSKKMKVYTTRELKEKITKDFGTNPWGKEMIAENFGIW